MAWFQVRSCWVVFGIRLTKVNVGKNRPGPATELSLLFLPVNLLVIIAPTYSVHSESYAIRVREIIVARVHYTGTVSANTSNP